MTGTSANFKVGKFVKLSDVDTHQVMKSIKILDEDLKRKLRSGYCVDSVSSCVQQLVLNSVEVTDDGAGIIYNDMLLAGERYATSKSYGQNSGWEGRGESLASIISLSYRVNIDSKCIHLQQGFGKSFEGNNTCIYPSSNISSQGTTVTVQNFLYTLPVRRGMIDSSIEMDKVKKILEEICLAYPHISISLYDVGNDVWRMKTTSGNFESVFCYTFGSNWKSLLKSFNGCNQLFTVRGFVSTKGYRNRNLQFVYLLKRRINNNYLQDFINKLLTQWCADDSFPIFIVFIECSLELCLQSYELCRMNVEFNHIEKLINLINELLLKLFKNVNKIQRTNNSEAPAVVKGDVNAYSQPILQSASVRRHADPTLSKPLFVNSDTSTERSFSSRKRKVASPLSDFVNKNNRQLRLTESLNHLANYELVKPKTTPINVEELLNKTFQDTVERDVNKNTELTLVELDTNLQACHLTKNHLSNVKLVGQVDSRFIVGVSDIGNCKEILIFDQHAVHERIRLERLLQDGLRSTEFGCPLNIPTDVNSKELLIKYQSRFAALSLTFELCEEQVTIKTIPQCFAEKEESVIKLGKPSILHKLIQKAIDDILESLRSMGTAGVTIPKTILELLKSQACHGAIKFGDILTPNESQQLLQQLNNCQLPFQCAHGRPTVVPLVKLSKN